MGFNTKLLSMAALQSTFLCRSADPSLDVLKDGLYDLFWLVGTHVISQGGKVKTRTCHHICALDLTQQGPRSSVLSSLSLEIHSSLDLHASFAFQQLPETE